VSLQIVRFTAAQDNMTKVERGIERLFAAVHAAGPEEMRYLAARTADGPDFLLMLHLAGGAANPLPAIPEAAAFRQDMQRWALTPPAAEPMTVLGDYRLIRRG
jgi:hypothetical protein